MAKSRAKIGDPFEFIPVELKDEYRDGGIVLERKENKVKVLAKNNCEKWRKFWVTEEDIIILNRNLQRRRNGR